MASIRAPSSALAIGRALLRRPGPGPHRRRQMYRLHTRENAQPFNLRRLRTRMQCMVELIFRYTTIMHGSDRESGQACTSQNSRTPWKTVHRGHAQRAHSTRAAHAVQNGAQMIDARTYVHACIHLHRTRAAVPAHRAARLFHEQKTDTHSPHHKRERRP